VVKLKNLCLNLAKAETEEEVIKLLKGKGYWDDPNCWGFYGDTENNFSTIGNQQSAPEAALVEKIVNSVDATLTKECLLRGINPESSAAPESIEEAMEIFFGRKRGVLASVNPLTRGKLAENISLVATGKKSNPCYSIIDKGEGQTPKDMPKTFLSLQEESNKLRIKFVQGKFNMGGTGALRFCGRHNLQLIISKRHPDLAKIEDDETADSWGFTIVRRENPSEGRRSSTYTYLAPTNEILNFKADNLLLLPGKYPKAFDKPLGWGTYLKLYEYQMKGLKTLITLDPYYRLSILLPNIAHPIRLYERRKGYDAHTPEITLSGISVRLDEDKRDNLEPGFPSSSSISAMGETMTCLIYAFKKDKHKTYTKKNEGTIFTVNGQTHGHISKNFFKRRSVGMSFLADSILVIVDCSNFRGRSREDLFMNSRDRLCDCDLRFEIESSLEEIIKKHPGLRELKERRKREEIESKLEDSKPLADVLNDILNKSPALASILIPGKRIHDPFNLMKVGEDKKPFEGKQFPTYFRLKKRSGKILEKHCSINRRFRVQYETDVENDYFRRDELPGRFDLKVNGSEVTDKSLNLWNGIATLAVELPPDVKEGDKLIYESEISDDRMINPFVESFTIITDKKAESVKKTGNGGERRKPPLQENGEEREQPSGLNLPDIREVRHDKWESHNFDKYSALRVDGGDEEGFTFWVNMDNIYLHSEIKSQASIEPKLLEARYMYSLVLIGLALLKPDSETKKEEDYEEITIFDKISDFTKAISPVILPMISSLGDLELPEN